MVVFAAGNDNAPVATEPYASHPLVLAVGALSETGEKADYSNFGPELDLVAPAGATIDGLFTTATAAGPWPALGGFTPLATYLSGTSASTPVVSGVAALVLSANPELSAAQVREILVDTARPIDRVQGRYDAGGHSPFYGRGMVDAYRAVRRAEALASRCTPLEMELCNGIDDDCDAMIDEGCTPVGRCAPCADDAECGATARCARSPADDHWVCLDTCDSACPSSYQCRAGLCVPADGRCDEPASEVCNTLDDDLNGDVDETCPASLPYCHHDLMCEEGEACVDATCTPRCGELGAPCASGFCLPRVDRFGERDGVYVCRDWSPQGRADSEEPRACFERCADPAADAAFAACARETHASCDGVRACLP